MKDCSHIDVDHRSGGAPLNQIASACDADHVLRGLAHPSRGRYLPCSRNAAPLCVGRPQETKVDLKLRSLWVVLVQKY